MKMPEPKWIRWVAWARYPRTTWLADRCEYSSRKWCSLAQRSPKAKRVEFRCPDASCNPYLAFSAMMLAGLDGVQNRIEPPDPVDKDLYDLPPEELALVPQVPASLELSLAALEADNDFLTVGGVFTSDLIETWLEYKRVHEIDEVRLRPHPWEFALYYDI